LTAVAKLLRTTITTDPYPSSPRLKPLKSALAKLDPPAPRSEPLPRPEAVDEQQHRAAEAEAMSAAGGVHD